MFEAGCLLAASLVSEVRWPFGDSQEPLAGSFQLPEWVNALACNSPGRMYNNISFSLLPATLLEGPVYF